MKSPFHEDDTKESFFDLYLEDGASDSETDRGRELAAFAARRRVKVWLESIGMERYRTTFEENGWVGGCGCCWGPPNPHHHRVHLHPPPLTRSQARKPLVDRVSRRE